MTAFIRHGCGAKWTGARTAHCAACHLTFSSDSAWAAHRRDSKCLPPSQAKPALKPVVQATSGTTIWRHAKERPDIEVSS